MSIGVTTNIGRVNQGDTAELYAGLRQLNEIPVNPEEIASVSYTIQLPNGSIMTPQYGEIDDWGQGFLRFTNTQELGEYRAVATFSLVTGEVRSVVLNFFVEDPFVINSNPVQMVVDQVWLRIEDAFDSVLGGPWLKDKTVNNFDQTKIADFVPEALLDINVQMPMTNAIITDFTQLMSDGSLNPDLPILTKGVLLRTTMHLIRSYIEQPIPAGAQVVYENRTQYSNSWRQYYALEYQEYISMVRLWKRQFLHLGHSKLLVSSKAGRVWPGAAYRTQNVGRFGY
jgi:hypothetical protein